MDQPSLQSLGLLLSNKDHVISGNNSPRKFSAGSDVSPFHCSDERMTLLEETISPRFSDVDNHWGSSLQGVVNQNEVTFGSNRNPANCSPFDWSPVKS